MGVPMKMQHLIDSYHLSGKIAAAAGWHEVDPALAAQMLNDLRYLFRADDHRSEAYKIGVILRGSDELIAETAYRLAKAHSVPAKWPELRETTISTVLRLAALEAEAEAE